MSASLSTGCFSGLRTGMARAIFTEVAEALERLASGGESLSIDLHSLPLTDADLAELEELLGRGEVSVELEVIGDTRIWETAYAGVWWIRHLGAGGRVASQEIAITEIPDILKSQTPDIQDAARRIRQHDGQVADAAMHNKEASNG
jgi:hydrogenase-1 operon protein HyaF